MSKIKVEWLTKSPSMYRYYSGIKNFHLQGGRLYELDAIYALRDDYDVKINPNFIKKETTVNYILKNHKRLIYGDICILDPYVIAFGKFDTRKKNIAVIHHIDDTLMGKSIQGKLFIKRILKNLQKVDKVIVVSQYWKQYLSEKGIKNIDIIYNAFPIQNYNFSDNQITDFKNRFQMPIDKPIIYLGQYGKGKGIADVLDVIDASKYHLVVTGKSNYPNENVHTHYFADGEFPLFLAACDVVVTMSTMIEGWNRTAHEAILVGTPVIGSGTGGMQELLKNTNQTVLRDTNSLNLEIEKSLKKDKAEINQAKEYLSQFDMNYFKSSWKRIIAEQL